MASGEFSPYDSTDYMTSLEDVALHFEAALKEAGDDPAKGNANTPSRARFDRAVARAWRGTRAIA